MLAPVESTVKRTREFIVTKVAGTSSISSTSARSNSANKRSRTTEKSFGNESNKFSIRSKSFADKAIAGIIIFFSTIAAPAGLNQLGMSRAIIKRRMYFRKDCVDHRLAIKNKQAPERQSLSRYAWAK